jgi:hypothetical protein
VLLTIIFGEALVNFENLRTGTTFNVSNTEKCFSVDLEGHATENFLFFPVYVLRVIYY